MNRQAGEAPIITHNWLGAPSARLRSSQNLLIGQQLICHAAFHVQLHYSHTPESDCQPVRGRIVAIDVRSKFLQQWGRGFQSNLIPRIIVRRWSILSLDDPMSMSRLQAAKWWNLSLTASLDWPKKKAWHSRLTGEKPIQQHVGF